MKTQVIAFFVEIGEGKFLNVYLKRNLGFVKVKIDIFKATQVNLLIKDHNIRIFRIGQE